MKIQFLGVGSAFTLPKSTPPSTLGDCDWQSNVMVISDSGKRFLIDCGSDIRFSLWQQGLSFTNIDAVYISHCHADHIGGLEWLAFTRKFTPGCQSPRLYAERNLIPEIWNALCPGLNSIEGQVTHLEDFYSVHPVDVNDSFTWEGICFSPVQTVHVMAGKKIKNSFGLIIEHNGKKVYFTTDTQFCPSQLDVFYKEADAIFQDCETSKFPSRVHAHYDVLKNLSLDIKGKMWLYHYQPYPEQDSVSDGFKGFAKKGQVYEF